MFEKLKGGIFRKRMPRGEAVRLFREVLEDHNRGLETVADMGDKLSGEFLFDVNYIRPAYSKLYAEVSGCVEKLGLLTGGKYPKLAFALARIDARVRDALDEVESSSGPFVIFHNDITWENEDEVGGKNAGIAEVRNLPGLNVPEGFALTLAAFDLFMRHNGLDAPARELESGGTPRQLLASLREKVLSAVLPEPLSAGIDAALMRMSKRMSGVISTNAIRNRSIFFITNPYSIQMQKLV